VKIKTIIIYAYWQIPVPYGSKLHILPSNYHSISGQQEAYKISLSLTEKCRRFSGEKNQENGQLAEK